MKDGQLTKILIKAFKDKTLRTPYSEYPEFELPVNPESYSQNFKIEYEVTKAQGSQGVDEKYTYTNPEELKLEFIVDATGTIEGYSKKLADKPVSQQIELLLNTTYYMIGETHKPPFLKVIHGENLVFHCLLTNLDINYTLFHPNGEPLRAKCSVTFLNYKEQERRVLEEDKRSPDLTHVRQVKGGDTLPLMTHEIYGNKLLYLQVARENGLTSFRNLSTGQDIVFPPLEKTPSQ